jgi:hypothetical protein
MEDMPIRGADDERDGLAEWIVVNLAAVVVDCRLERIWPGGIADVFQELVLGNFVLYDMSVNRARADSECGGCNLVNDLYVITGDGYGTSCGTLCALYKNNQPIASYLST